MLPYLRWLTFTCGLLIGGMIYSHARAAEVGMVAAFALSSCPENWSAYSSAVGRVVVGVGTLGSDTYTLAATGGEARHTLTLSEIPSHSHGLVRPAGGPLTGQRHALGLWDCENCLSHSGFFEGGGQPHENRPPFVALLYCVRTAEDQAEGGSVGFWPEMSMTDAMEIGAAVLLTFGLAWGVRVAVASLINR